MIYVYKKSSKPFNAWSMIDVAGANNIAPDARTKYLILRNTEAVQRDGMWHYIFEFDVRNSLEISPLAQMMGGHKTSYSDAADWNAWLGPDFHVITSSVRDEILNLKAADGKPDITISNVRELSRHLPKSENKLKLLAAAGEVA